LHNSKTKWNTYRQIIQDKVNLPIKLKGHEDTELETNNLLNLLQRAAKKATPNSDPQRTANNIPYEIKRLAAEKRRARSIWQRTNTPDSRRICNRTSNKLKSKLQEMRNESFEKYFSNLKRKDNSIWQPIKKRGKPKTTSPHYANIQHLRDHGQKVTRKKAELFAEHLSEVFAPHNNDQDQGVEQDLATPVQSKECLRAFTLKEIRDEIKILDKKRHQISTLLLPEC